MQYAVFKMHVIFKGPVSLSLLRLKVSEFASVCYVYLHWHLFSYQELLTVMCQEWPFTTESQEGLWVICFPQDIHFSQLTFIIHQ